MDNSIERYLQLDDDSIYSNIGEAAILHQGLQGTESFREKLSTGIKIFNQYKEVLKNKICSNRELQKTIQSEGLNTSLNIISLIVSIINNLVIPGTAILVAVLLVRYGILKYCEMI